MATNLMIPVFPHQEQGVARILHGFCTAVYATKAGQHKPCRSLLLHDDMGLGKTRQALEAVRRMMETDRIAAYPNSPVIIVAPAACLDVWQKEIADCFSAHFTDIRLFINNTATAATLQNVTCRTIIITSYSTLRAAFHTFLHLNLSLGSMNNAELARLCIVHGSGQVAEQLLLTGDRATLLKMARAAWNEQANKPISTKHAQKTQGYAQLMRLDYNVLVLDEIHVMKNVASKACKAVAFVGARYRLGLSGTPTMNHGGEMLTILKYGLGLFDANWNEIYQNPDGPYCRTLLENVCFGRRKADVPSLQDLLPTRDAPAIEHVVLDWTEDVAAEQLYVQIREASVKTLDEIGNLRQGIGEDRADYNARRSSVTQTFWGMFQQLRKVCLHHFLVLAEGQQENTSIPRGILYEPQTAFAFPVWLQRKCLALNLSLLRFGMPLAARNCAQTWLTVAERREIQASPKMLQLMNIIRQVPGKVVVVSQFRSFLETILEPWLRRNGVGSILFGGGTRAKQQTALREFHENAELRVLLVVKSAGAHGLNLQADSATVVIMEPHFNDALDEQASQRVDRIGQLERAVIIRKLFMKGSVDIALYTMQQRKMAITDNWMGRAEGMLTLESVGLFLASEDQVGKRPL
jgi:SNF2 family DNA or RNA helicase